MTLEIALSAQVTRTGLVGSSFMLFDLANVESESAYAIRLREDFSTAISLSFHFGITL
jgi:hypothetical protein